MTEIMQRLSSNLHIFIYFVFFLILFFLFLFIRGSALAAASNGDPVLGKQAILELMAAVEEAIPTPVRETDKPFLMPIEDIFSIQGRGTVVTGRIEQGAVRTGEDLEISGMVPTALKTTCTGESGC